MENASQWRHSPVDVDKHVRQLLLVSKIRFGLHDLGAHYSQILQGLLGFGRCSSTSAHEHHMTSATLDYPFGKGEAEPTESAGNEVGRVRTKSDDLLVQGIDQGVLFSHRNHDLSD